MILAFPRSFYFAVNFTARPADSRDPTRNRTRYNPLAAISAISKQFHFVRERTKKILRIMELPVAQMDTGTRNG